MKYGNVQVMMYFRWVLGLTFFTLFKADQHEAVLFVTPAQPRPACRIYIKAVHLETPSDVRHNRIRFSYFLWSKF